MIQLNKDLFISNQISQDSLPLNQNYARSRDYRKMWKLAQIILTKPSWRKTRHTSERNALTDVGMLKLTAF